MHHFLLPRIDSMHFFEEGVSMGHVSTINPQDKARTAIVRHYTLINVTVVLSVRFSRSQQHSKTVSTPLARQL